MEKNKYKYKLSLAGLAPSLYVYIHIQISMYRSIARSTSQDKERKFKQQDDIAIVGIGCRLPGGSRTPQQFYDQLLQGLDGITTSTPDRWSKSFSDQNFINTDNQ